MSRDGIRHEGEEDFAKPIARALLRDARLSFGARGLFVYLWDLPKGWKVNSAHLATQSPAGKDAIRSMLAELAAVGAMSTEAILQEEGKGKFCGTRWVVYAPKLWAVEAPLSNKKTERGETRPSVPPTVGEPASKVLRGFKDHKVEGKGAAATDLAIIQNDADQYLLDSLIDKFGDAKIEAAAIQLARDGKRPYPSFIKKIIEADEKTAKKQAEKQSQGEPESKRAANTIPRDEARVRLAAAKKAITGYGAA